MVTYGDPTLNPTLSKGKAKDQTLTGIDSQTNTIVGDVNYITNKGSGGKDKLTGGDDTSNVNKRSLPTHHLMVGQLERLG